MNIADYITKVTTAKTGRRVMARVLLNVAAPPGDKEAFDISELRNLRHEDRMFIESFLDWATAVYPAPRMCDNQAAYIRAKCLS